MYLMLYTHIGIYYRKIIGIYYRKICISTQYIYLISGNQIDNYIIYNEKYARSVALEKGANKFGEVCDSVVYDQVIIEIIFTKK